MSKDINTVMKPDTDDSGQSVKSEIEIGEIEEPKAMTTVKAKQTIRGIKSKRTMIKGQSPKLQKLLEFYILYVMPFF